MPRSYSNCFADWIADEPDPFPFYSGVALEGADMDTMTRFRDYLTTHGFSLPFVLRGERYFCGMRYAVDCETGGK